MKLPPLALEIAIHYFWSPKQYGRLYAPSVCRWHERFVALGLLSYDMISGTFGCTPALKEYVARLCDVPLVAASRGACADDNPQVRLYPELVDQVLGALVHRCVERQKEANNNENRTPGYRAFENDGTGRLVRKTSRWRRIEDVFQKLRNTRSTL